MSVLSFEASDRLNPIVVKEVRQGLRTKVFVGSFLTLLALCGLIVMGAWAKHSPDSESTGMPGDGLVVFTLIYLCLAFISFFVLPFTAYRSLVAERTEETWSTLVLTRLTARQILRGKIVSALVQGALYASAAGPFLLFSYFLQGVSLAVILIALFVGAVFEAFLVTLSVCWATFVPPGTARQINFFALLIVLGLLFSMTIGFLEDAVRSPASLVTHDAFVVYAAVLALIFTGGLTCFELAAARLAPTSANTAIGPRLALSLHLAVVFAFATYERGSNSMSAILSLVYGSLWILGLGLYGLASADAPPAALMNQRSWTGLLLPGALRGWRFAVVAGWLWAALLFAMVPTIDDFEPTAFVSIPALLTIYVGFPGIVRCISKAAPHFSVRLTFLAMLILLCLVPAFAAIALDVRATDPLFALFNPFIILDSGAKHLHGWHHAMISWGLWIELLSAAGIAVIADSLLRQREAKAKALRSVVVAG